MNLHQLQLSYQSGQDRILFRVSFTDEAGTLMEVRAWLTRRLVRKLWDGIVRAMETQISLEKPEAVHAKAEIMEMAFQDSVSRTTQAGSFSQPFHDASRDLVLGGEPILVETVHIGVNANRPMTVNFRPGKGHGFEIAFTREVLHGFCSLLQQAACTADWDLALKLPGASAAANTTRVLN